MQIDFGKTTADYSRHRAGFPAVFFDRLFGLGAVSPNDRALDVGTGVGTVARGLALRGCAVVGLDASSLLLDEARRLDDAVGVRVEYVIGRAEDTGQQGCSFDVVTAGQCWRWFNRARASMEALRLLAPGGKLIIANFDWLPLRGNVVEATERLILDHNPEWRGANGNGVYPAWFDDLTTAGFTEIESFSLDLDVSYSHEAWLGRIRASAGVGASLSPESVARFDRAHEEILKSKFPQDPLTIPHRVFAVFGRAPKR
jgi:SAM-dependent methyltransferase